MTDPGTPCDFCGVDDATRQLRITTSAGIIHPKACAGCHDEITRVQNNWALTDHVLAHRNLTMTDLETPTTSPNGASTMTNTETPADTIRRAARLIRERANAATPGPWEPFDGPPIMGFKNFGIRNAWKEASYVAGANQGGGVYFHEDAAHIASWHPAVALAVANMLDLVCGRHTLTADLTDDDCCRDCTQRWPCGPIHTALNVALAYLGETDA